MDDPWGSPWATNDSNPTLELEPPPRASTTLELPSRTLTRVRSSSSISPWATIDENTNGFGGWGSPDPSLVLPPPTAAAAAGGGWSGWGGENGLNSSQTNLSVRAREGSLGLPSPSAWPTASSPSFGQGKTLSRRSSDKSLFRQPSPDPWAAEFSQDRLSLPAAVHISAEQAAFSTLSRHDERDENGQGEIESREAVAGLGLAYETDESRSLGATTFPEDTDRNKVEQGPRLEDSRPGRDLRSEVQPGSPSDSRHSSVSNESQHEERLDSPITSMDEDAKDRQATPRRPSAKVQELVDMYDGLVKRKDSALLVPDQALRRKRSASRSMSIRSARTDDASDFGDFEDAEDFVSSRHPSVSGSPRPTSARGSHLRSVSRSSLRKNAATAVTVTSPVLEEAPNRFQELLTKYGPAKFDTDLALVDKLFDVEKLDKEQPAAKDYSLDAIDGIIMDNFTTVSERKTWYRISRSGTMRKHDMGDDDNYRRVTWADSKVREDATNIVRRWTEEDTYTGRPAMGGGSMVKGGGFNWDSKAEAREPLSFDQIFGKRKSAEPPKTAAAHIPRPLSLQPQASQTPHSRNSSVSVNSLPPRSPMGIPGPATGVAFGWSTGTNGSMTPNSSRPSGQFARQSMDVKSFKSEMSRPSSVHGTENKNPLQLAPPPAAPISTAVPESRNSAQPVQKEEDDDDDEWGEMVASPSIENRPSSILFDGSLNGSVASLPFTTTTNSMPTKETSATLEAVSSKLSDEQAKSCEVVTDSSSIVPSDTSNIWDFSAFESKPALQAIPPTITSKPEFDFDTPLQSPTLTIPSRSGSPASFQISKPPTPIIPSPRTGSPVSVHNHKPATPPLPFRAQHRSSSSLSLVRPSPLHHVITPKPTSPDIATETASSRDPAPASASLEVVEPIKNAQKTVSFANVEEETVVDLAIVRQVVESLPDLSYMLR